MKNEYRTFALSTIDNPFNPFDDFDNWFLFDCEKGYYSLSRIARLSNTSEDMSDKEEAIATEKAIERLIEIDPLNIYIKVYKNNNSNNKIDNLKEKNEENKETTDTVDDNRLGEG